MFHGEETDEADIRLSAILKSNLESRENVNDNCNRKELTLKNSSYKITQIKGRSQQCNGPYLSCTMLLPLHHWKQIN